MSSNRVEWLSPEASASFWDMVCVALMSSNQVSMNQTKTQSSRLILSGSGCAKPVVGHFWCVLTATLGPPLCALDNESGHPSVILVFQPMFSLASHSVVVCMKPGT